MYDRFDHEYKHIDLPNKHKVVYDWVSLLLIPIPTEW